MRNIWLRSYVSTIVPCRHSLPFNLRCCWQFGFTGAFSLPRPDGASCIIWQRSQASSPASISRFRVSTLRSLHRWSLIGGILIMLGLFSRPIAFLLACNMFVAYWTADREALTAIFSDPGKFYVADPYTFLFASLMILIFGAGLFSIDTLISKRLQVTE